MIACLFPSHTLKPESTLLCKTIANQKPDLTVGKGNVRLPPMIMDRKKGRNRTPDTMGLSHTTPNLGKEIQNELIGDSAFEEHNSKYILGSLLLLIV